MQLKDLESKRSIADILAILERDDGLFQLDTLLDEAVAAPNCGHVIGLTGPPGVGKSTLSNLLLRSWRIQGLSVAVLAVDPSSQTSGGALLGDRTRLQTDPADQQVFVRSLAARNRLGGLSISALVSTILMRALYDRVLVETVGIGQSEADLAFVADTFVLCVQPGSGDSLQFMKAGIMELPDLVVVTKADMQQEARRAIADVEGALGLTGNRTMKAVPVFPVSSLKGTGLDDLLKALEDHIGDITTSRMRDQLQRARNQRLIEDLFRIYFGENGLRAARQKGVDFSDQTPFSQLKTLVADFTKSLEK